MTAPLPSDPCPGSLPVSRRYVIVSPVRDEAKHLPGTIQSVASQTVLPERWIIVNDGSKDDSGVIAEAAARQHPWIKVVHLENRGFRKNGGGVVEAFNKGFAELGGCEWDIIVKLDGDLTFKSDYFETCLKKFESDPKLGVSGGAVMTAASGGTEEESPSDPPFHVRGAVKMYCRPFFEASGGLLPAAGWDTLDEVHANMLGWRSYTIKTAKVIHHRPTGSADGSMKNLFKNGLANYMVGYHPLFMAAKCVKRITQAPPVLGSCALMWGFLSGYVKRIPRVRDEKIISYLRKEQMKRLFAQPSIYGGQHPDA